MAAQTLFIGSMIDDEAKQRGSHLIQGGQLLRCEKGSKPMEGGADLGIAHVPPKVQFPNVSACMWFATAYGKGV